ncbi:MAG: hypothetical protein EXR07_12000 [Acetobacteraceae bacterium]|nr:hypothetical protein [Acetobacteraceae bacterium]
MRSSNRMPRRAARLAGRPAAVNLTIVTARRVCLSHRWNRTGGIDSDRAVWHDVAMIAGPTLIAMPTNR